MEREQAWVDCIFMQFFFSEIRLGIISIVDTKEPEIIL